MEVLRLADYEPAWGSQNILATRGQGDHWVERVSHEKGDLFASPYPRTTGDWKVIQIVEGPGK